MREKGCIWKDGLVTRVVHLGGNIRKRVFLTVEFVDILTLCIF